jgi:RNA polymerase sigma factor (TIGR02999 family)
MPPGDSRPGTKLRDEATACLVRIAKGDRSAKDELFELVYGELRAQASSYLSNESPGHTLQSTALVHEAWLRMIHQDRAEVSSKGHFLALAAQCMRRIMIDHARTRRRSKRGGSWGRVELDEAAARLDDEQGCADLMAVDQALEKLRQKSERMASIVEMHFFGGLSLEQVAEALDISRSTVLREWRAARALMSRLLGAVTDQER